jgi:hypothetical protein
VIRLLAICIARRQPTNSLTYINKHSKINNALYDHHVTALNEQG